MACMADIRAAGYYHDKSIRMTMQKEKHSTYLSFNHNDKKWVIKKKWEEERK